MALKLLLLEALQLDVGLVHLMVLICLLVGERSHYLKSRVHLSHRTGLICFRFLYMLILAVDGNFRLKSRLRSSDDNDPSLVPGAAYCVDRKPYLNYLKGYVTEKDVSAPPAPFAAQH